MPENLLSMQISHIRYTNMDFFKTPHIQIQLLGKDPVFKYEFLVLFIYPCSRMGGVVFWCDLQVFPMLDSSGV